MLQFLIPIYNAKNAIAYTEVPEKLKDLGKQRKDGLEE